MLPEERLVARYGFLRGNTTEIERIHHVFGEECPSGGVA
jgi:hypothetical protein